MVDNYAAFFNCTPEGRASDSIKLFILVGWGWSFLSVAWPTVFFFSAPSFIKLFGAQGSPSSDSLLNLLSSTLIHQGGYHDLFVCP